MSQDDTHGVLPAALRMWLDAPNLMASYERHGIVIVTVGLRMEAATAAASKLAHMIAEYRASGAGDPERLDTLDELVAMMRDVLRDKAGQILPLDANDASPFDALFGATS
jgi:hypothetical protein